MYVLQPGLDQINTLHKLQHCYYYCNAGVRIGIWVANEPILNAEGGRKSTFQLKISFSIEHNSYTPDSLNIWCQIIYKSSSIKIIKGEVVTEIFSFISRHIFAKLAEFYFHTYGFFF